MLTLDFRTAGTRRAVAVLAGQTRKVH